MLANPTIAEHSRRFFKTGKGEYGEGDRFLGIRVPALRAFAKRHRDQTIGENVRLLSSRYHEERLLALIMMVNRFAIADEPQRQEIYKAYLDNTRYINNWDLVDSSAHQIVGGFLIDKNRCKLGQLSRSENLWERRISIIATYHFIKRDQYNDTLTIAKQLLNDKEDLIHKAVGWMLREVGKRDRKAQEHFLLNHYRTMPRTMLRYAIERFEVQERKQYMDGTK